MSDAQLTPLQQWLIEVAAQAKQRPWIDAKVYARCSSCGADDGNVWPNPRPTAHKRDCPFLAIDAALDKEPTLAETASPPNAHFCHTPLACTLTGRCEKQFGPAGSACCE